MHSYIPNSTCKFERVCKKKNRSLFLENKNNFYQLFFFFFWWISQRNKEIYLFLINKEIYLVIYFYENMLNCVSNLVVPNGE